MREIMCHWGRELRLFLAHFEFPQIESATRKFWTHKNQRKCIHLTNGVTFEITRLYKRLSLRSENTNSALQFHESECSSMTNIWMRLLELIRIYQKKKTNQTNNKPIVITTNGSSPLNNWKLIETKRHRT